MEIKKATSIEQIESIRPLATDWKGMCSCSEFGLEVNISTFLAGLMDLIDDDDSDLLLLMDNEIIIGIMGLTKFKSPFGKEEVANEHYLFVRKGSGVTGSKRLIDAAMDWAKEKGCSHLILNASNAASDMHDKICGFYEHIGLKKFETSYIKEIL